ncbi:MAG TPA: alpha/beta fold hydrolase [Candidatus Acidoferrum sp.]|nr:alpha/beta fold hydrolase [Candidatus Acidoferrum sp.]
MPPRAEPVPLYRDICGNPAGPPIVLLHGLGSSSSDWRFQLPALSAAYRVIAPDLRGHGRSPRGAGRLTVATLAADVAALLQSLAAPPAHVVGLSLGGCVALALALDHPARVRSLTLVNTFARPVTAGPRGTLRLLARLGLLACAPMRTVAAHVARGLFPRPDQRELYLAAVASLASNPRRTYFAALRGLARFDVSRRLAELRCPTLVMAGDRDATVPLAAKRLLQQSIPGAELIVVEDSGHVTPCDQAERFNALLLGFIDVH